jgi:hypothetical protein
MAAKPVAVEGDVSATVGTAPFTGAEAGTWTAGSVSLTSHANLKVGGKKAVWKATCTFSFTGQSSSGATVNGSETVTLTATTKLLDKSQSSVLVDGDQAQGNYGNKLTASATGALKTS